jgi:Holliday junction resolvase RusA-like endonuclease
MVIYSAQFREWETRALVELRQTWNGKTIDQPLEAVFRFYFKNRQAESDLSNVIEAPQDALTKAGVIIDDKIIQVIHATKIFGHEPRVEIELRHI